MGYAHYVLADGRQAGYAVKDICNDNDCTEEIDRGLAYLCGETPGGDEWGCGGYFCGAHLFLHYNYDGGRELPQLCQRCMDQAVS
jgi:hypothetical protein